MAIGRDKIMSLTLISAGMALYYCVILMLLAYYDYKSFRLPNVLNGLLFVGGLMSLLLHPRPWQEVILFMVLFGGGLYALSYYYLKRRGQVGLGLGDVKLVIAAGIWLPIIYMPLILLGASLSALIVTIVLYYYKQHRGLLDITESLRQQKIPFGLYLCFWFIIIYLSQAYLYV